MSDFKHIEQERHHIEVATHDPAVGLADALTYLQAQAWTVPQGLLRRLP